MLKVKVDQTKCIGCGLCASLCGEIFELNSGKSQVKEGVKIDESKKCIKEAMINCPVEAISLKDSKN